MTLGPKPAALLAAVLAVLLTAQAAIGVVGSWLPVKSLGGTMAGPGAMAMAKLDTVGMTYTETPGFEGRVFFRRSFDGGATWQAASPMSPAGGDAHDAALAAHANHFDMVWIQADANGDHRVKYRHSTDRGATWSRAKTLSPKGVGAYPPRVARDGQGRVAVVWVGAELGVSVKVYVRVSLDGGATFGPRRALDSTATSFSFPNVAIAHGKIQVAYNDGGKVVYRKSGDNGSSWRSARTLASGTDASSAPAMAAEGLTLVIGYTLQQGGDRWVAYRRSLDKGQNWQPQATLASQSGRDTWGLILSVDSGTWRALFARCDSDDPCNATTPRLVMRSSVDDAATWSASRVVPTSGKNIAIPAGISGDEKAVVAWMRDNGAMYAGVYARREQ